MCNLIVTVLQQTNKDALLYASEGGVERQAVGDVLRLALDSRGHEVDLQSRRDSVMPIVFVLLGHVVSELVFSGLWPGCCAVVGAEMRVGDLDIELSRSSVLKEICVWGKGAVLP